MADSNFKEDDSILVLDAGPLIGGINPNILNDMCFTTSEIINEVRNKRSRRKIENILYSNSLIVMEPKSENISKINAIAGDTGDLKSLSDADIGIIALAYELMVKFSEDTSIPQNDAPLKFLTDDYSLQNVARKCGIHAKSYRSRGIRTYIQWETYCPSCYRTYDSTRFGTPCSVCGDRLKRRKKKKRKKGKR